MLFMLGAFFNCVVFCNVYVILTNGIKFKTVIFMLLTTVGREHYEVIAGVCLSVCLSVRLSRAST